MPSRRAPRRTQDPGTPRPPQRAASPTSATLPEHELADDGLYREVAFGPLDLAGSEARDAEFERCAFDGTRLPAAALERATLTDVVLDRCDLANLRLTGARVFTTAVSGTRLTGAACTDCAFQDVVFDACRADLAGFRFSTFRRVLFRDCNLEGATFQSADLRGVRFEGCRMGGVQFSGATAAGARFTGCDLRGVAGVPGLRGAIVAAGDAPGLLASLAAELEITIEDGPGDRTCV